MFRRKARPDTQRDLEAATESLAEATHARKEQESKRQKENTELLQRFEKIAQGNHLAEQLFRAFTERYGRE
jgi:hypothetical protein